MEMHFSFDKMEMHFSGPLDKMHLAKWKCILVLTLHNIILFGKMEMAKWKHNIIFVLIGNASQYKL